MKTQKLINKKPNKYQELEKEETIHKFNDLNEEEQSKVLLEMLNLLTDMKTVYDLKLINITATRGKQNFDLTSLKEFTIIEQSVTGFYEKEITIIGDKENDMENNNS